MKISRMNLNLFLLPAISLLVIFRIYPIFIAVSGSFLSSGFARPKSFIGFSNFISLFMDPTFWQSIKTTLLLNMLINPIQIVLALFMAILVNQKMKGMNLFRSIYYIPVGISITVASIIWGILMNPNAGIINSLLGLLHIPAQPFLTSSREALMSIIIIASWKGVAYWMMFLLAGLKGISGSIYEASKIDGCSTWDSIIKITIPLLKRTLAFVIVADTVANILMFAPMYLLTNGGPEMSTNVLMLEAYRSAFQYVDMGRAYSLTTVLLVLLFMIVGIQMKLMKADY